MPEVSDWELQEAIHKTKLKKSCCRFDMVVAEMVKPLLYRLSVPDALGPWEAFRKCLSDDLCGVGLPLAESRRRLVTDDVPHCILPPEKRARLHNDMVEDARARDVQIKLEVPLLPKMSSVTHPPCRALAARAPSILPSPSS